MWCDPDSTKIEPIGVPASLNREVGMSPLGKCARHKPRAKRRKSWSDRSEQQPTHF